MKVGGFLFSWCVTKKHQPEEVPLEELEPEELRKELPPSSPPRTAGAAAPQDDLSSGQP